MKVERIRNAALALGVAGLMSACVASGGHMAVAQEIKDTAGLFPAGAKVTQIVGEPDGFFYEGPAMSHDGTLYFSDIAITPAKGLRAGITWKYNPETKKATVYRSPSGMSNGIAFDAKGRMVVVHQADYGLRMVTRTELATGISEIVTGQYGGHPYNAPNDLTIDSKGRIWFTDPEYDHRGWEQQEQNVRGVYRIDPDNSVHLVVADVRQPNGVAMSPDESKLYVCNFDFGTSGPMGVKDDFKGTMPPITTQLRVYDVQPDGSTKFNKVLYELTPEAGCDGIKVDEKGNIYMARGTMPEFDVYSPDGKKLASVTIPGKGAFLLNVGWGRGTYDHTLYLTASNGVFEIQTTNKASGLQ